ncbi:hypothetical protein ACHHYP_17133 [Achlya hypogyna]|uniref:RING-type domain-containing protein n=1 Tax=Achlya hypogyna TaxID=1202772 RepID=A0A1V9Y575_ACHHY|nr:hypothetical protein ACHHYP_17133 [Achlya hypogyna]
MQKSPSTDELPFLVLAKSIAQSLPSPRSSTTDAISPLSVASGGTSMPAVSIEVSIGSGHSFFGYFVQYDITLVCPLTHRSWTVSKRYSEVLAFRQRLVELRAAGDLAHHLEEALTLPFPKKYIDAEKPHVIAARIKGFEAFVGHLLALYTECALPGSARGALTGILADFLQVPSDIQDMTFEAPAASLCHDDCTICIDAFEVEDVAVPGGVLKLSCGHCFHRDCLHDWCAQAMTCPVCRGPITRITGLYDRMA